MEHAIPNRLIPQQIPGFLQRYIPQQFLRIITNYSAFLRDAKILNISFHFDFRF
jgi:hypothetical protein